MTGRGTLVALADQFRSQAGACGRLGSALYADILGRVADNVELGGPFADLVTPWSSAPIGDALPLRLMGGVHALVLDRSAPELALFYPTVGGGATDGAARWAAFHDLVVSRGESLTSWLDRAPQTNEVGRAAALLGGLRVAQRWSGDRPVRLFEIGSSAGLNLWVDELPIGESVLMATRLPPARSTLRVAERSGCDLHPIDVTSPADRLRLSAYVWADDLVRFDRLRMGLAIGARHGQVVQPASAAAFVERLHCLPGHLTVLWHSVMWQYLDPLEQDRVTRQVDRLVGDSSPDAPFAYLTLEPSGDSSDHDPDRLPVRLRLAPFDFDEVIGYAPAHGVPVDWSSLALSPPGVVRSAASGKISGSD